MRNDARKQLSWDPCRLGGRAAGSPEAADDATPECPGPPAGQPLGGRQPCRLV